MPWMLIAVLMILLSPPISGTAEIGKCDPRVGDPYVWTAGMRSAVRGRARHACESLGASTIICDYIDEIVVRESSGRASIRHTKGEGEDGLGPMGLSLKWHSDKWEGDDEDPMFCQPEVSVLISLEIMRRAIERYNAVDIVGIQAVFGGHWKCERRHEYLMYEVSAWGSFAVSVLAGHADPIGIVVGIFVGRTGPRECFPAPRSLDICDRLRARGVSCWDPIDTRSLGKHVPLHDRRRKADELVRAGIQLSGNQSE